MKSLSGILLEENHSPEWTVEKLLKKLKKLNNTRKTAEKSNFLRSHNLVPKVELTYDFTPHINEKSKQLAAENEEKFPEYHDPSVSKVSDERNFPLSNYAGQIIKKENLYSKLSKSSSTKGKSDKNVGGVYGRIKQLSRNMSGELEKKRSQDALSSYRTTPLSHMNSNSNSNFTTKSAYSAHKRYELLYQKQRQTQQKIEYKKKLLFQAEESKCTFRPVINKRAASPSSPKNTVFFFIFILKRFFFSIKDCLSRRIRKLNFLLIINPKLKESLKSVLSNPLLLPSMHFFYQVLIS